MLLHMSPPQGDNLLRKLTFFLSFICLSLISTAQVKKITGTVTDSTGSPLQGVSVMVAKSKTGTSTDASGRFTINAAVGATLVFTYGNHEAARVTVGDEMEYRVKLANQVSALNDIVVIGYGRQKRVNLVGAVGTVNVDEKITGRALPNISEGLTG
ncbi:MAG TPA: carboxypeptidase-like regulatory domain-containing protein, partial [Puia sp.]|nr:carboxypeptidase-like regulatory domain-containing protein [Puia sp.]